LGGFKSRSHLRSSQESRVAPGRKQKSINLGCPLVIWYKTPLICSKTVNGGQTSGQTREETIKQKH
jgi:hypothetical protein